MARRKQLVQDPETGEWREEYVLVGDSRAGN
jgi:hypothetical protein